MKQNQIVAGKHYEGKKKVIRRVSSLSKNKDGSQQAWYVTVGSHLVENCSLTDFAAWAKRATAMSDADKIRQTKREFDSMLLSTMRK